MASLNQRLFAWGNDRTENARNKVLGKDKTRLLSTAKGTVVEIGIGSGGNMQYYPKSISLIGIEPNDAMPQYIRRNSQKFGMPLTVVDSHGEVLPMDTGTIDTVVTTHVLCSVRDVQKTLQEILRILKPGGQYLFIEHVAAESGTVLRFMQNVVRGLHSAVFAGCQCNREIDVEINRAGFSRVDLLHKPLKTFLTHVTPHIVGSATK